MTRLERFFFRDLLPGSISGDATIRAMADALDPIFAAIVKSVPNLLIWHRLSLTAGRPVPAMLPPIARLVAAAGGLTPLSTAELELLAWQFHLDFREVARTDAELAGMILDSIPWHRIKGTPASMRTALELCGYRDVILEESGEGDYWATYQVGLSGITGMDDLARIVSICRKMQPARCRLWRAYTPEYDFRPGTWSGPLPLCAWSNCWWSEYSGAEVPGIPGLDDDTDLIVSFGSRVGYLIQSLCGGEARAGLLLTLVHGWQAPLLLFPAWSQCRWGDVFPRDHSFTFSHLYSFTWAEAFYEPYAWEGEWDDRPWRGRLLRVDRRLPPWRFHVQGYALTEAVWSGCEPGYSATFVPDPAHGRVLPDLPGSWSALNGFWGCPPEVETLPAPQVWSDAFWSEDALAPERTEVLEVVACLRGEAVEPLRPGAPVASTTVRICASTAPLFPDASPGWTGTWDNRRWRGQCAGFEIRNVDLS